MKVVAVFLVVLVLGVFVSAALGDDWDSFGSGGDAGQAVNNSSAGTGDAGASDDVGSGSSSGGEGVYNYTDDFYIALGVGAVGILIIVVFAYFFFKKPKNRWKKK